MYSNKQDPLGSSERAFLDKLPYQVTPTNIPGVYSNPAIPDDFDHRTATQDDFTKLGLMFPKPDKERSPIRHSIYENLFSRRWLAKDRIIPECHPRIGKVHILRGKPTRVSDTSFNTNNWAGAGQNSQNYTGIVGNWTIPTVSKPPEPAGAGGGWHVSTWVGIDGMFISNDVFQAGIEQDVDANGNVTCIPWYEWFVPDDGSGLPAYIYETPITNFPVAPGDKIFCFCYYQDHIAGNIILANNTNGAYFNITLAPPAAPMTPSPANFNGSSAEWIVEAPSFGGNVSSLAKFTEVSFTDCLACVSGSSDIHPGDCDQIEVQDAAGAVLTNVVLNGTGFTVDFIG
jgi:hypothetical protein